MTARKTPLKRAAALGAVLFALAGAGAAQAQTWISCNGSLFAFDQGSSQVWQYRSNTGQLESMCGDAQLKLWGLRYQSGADRHNFDSVSCSVDSEAVRVTVNWSNGVQAQYFEVYRRTGQFRYVTMFGGTALEGVCQPAEKPRPRENLF